MKIEGKKIILVGIFIVFILVFSFGFVNSKGGSDKIEKKVYDNLNAEKSARVVILLKNNSDKKVSLKEIHSKFLTDKIENNSSLLLSALITKKDLKNLEDNTNILSVKAMGVKYISLQQSAPLINATSTWTKQLNGINLTGKNQAICIIDTGINYSHLDFGGCQIKNLTNLGNPMAYILQSPHQYLNFSNTTWKINYTGFSNISIHFKNISTEEYYDYVEILDGNNNSIINYSGRSMVDVWTPTIRGDTAYIRMISDDSVEGYGFYIDQILNGTSNTSYSWQGCSKVIGGWDFCSGDEYCYTQDPDPMDVQGHGTHVAGIAAANGGIMGVAPNANIVFVKASNSSGSFFDDSLRNSIDWCVANSDKYNISVISMSLGGGLYSNYCDNIDDPADITSAINTAVAKNISVVVASGNSGSTTQISSPACIQNATPIGSIRKDGFTVDYNRNSIVNLLAPGYNINSTIITGGYSGPTWSGTSMAAPHVSGAIAIINQYLRLRGQTKTPAEIENMLNATGKRIYDASSGLNFSRIDVYSAIRSLCSDNLANTSWQNLGNISSCRANNTLLYNFSRIEYDANNCGLTNNITYYIINESSCDSCIPNWTSQNTNNIIWYKDTNNCYVQTNLSSDLEGRPFNLSMQIEENKTQFFDNESNNSLILEMNFNFSASNNYFSSINISKENNESNFSYTIIRGIDLSENATWTKTVYLNKTLNSNIICIKDAEIDSIQNISANCNEPNEYLFNTCPVVLGNYSCLDNGTKFKLTGLRNSGIKEMEPFCGDGLKNQDETGVDCGGICASCPSTNSGGSSGGGGGGGSQVYQITSEQLSNGFTKNFVSGERANFVISGKNHSISITKIDSKQNKTNITIRSEPINVELKIGEEIKLNLTSLEYLDLYIKLENITSSKVNLKIKNIFEARPAFISKDKGKQYNIMNETNESTTNSDNAGINVSIKYQIAIIIFLAFFSIIYYLIVRKHRLRKRKSK